MESTTGLRCHPLEEVLTMLWKGLFIIVLGAPFSGVLIYEVIRDGFEPLYPRQRQEFSRSFGIPWFGLFS